LFQQKFFNLAFVLNINFCFSI
jgi:uncharacterized iron-regulated membrane protein